MSKPPNSPKKILLADDSVTMHRAVKLGLKKEPFDVICCDNGADAWRIVKQEKPDAVLADLDMPGMTGAELCQKIKSDPELASIPVILVCGSFDQVDEKHLETVPSDARLWKPFETHVLISLLSKVLGTSSLRESAEPTAVQPRQPTHSGTESTAFETTRSEHLHEPLARGTEIPSVQDSDSLIEGFQDVSFGESTGSHFTEINEIELPELSNPAAPTSYENLWTSEPTQAVPAVATQPTTPVEATAQGEWGAIDNSEKSFTNEVFEAVESRHFDGEYLGEQKSNEATEMPDRVRTESTPASREETSQSFPPAASSGTSKPPVPRGARQATVVPRPTNAAPSSMLDHATATGLSEEQVRKIIRDEIQTAINGWLKNRLHEELERVIEEIDRE